MGGSVLQGADPGRLCLQEGPGALVGGQVARQTLLKCVSPGQGPARGMYNSRTKATTYVGEKRQTPGLHPRPGGLGLLGALPEQSLSSGCTQRGRGDPAFLQGVRCPETGSRLSPVCPGGGCPLDATWREKATGRIFSWVWGEQDPATPVGVLGTLLFRAAETGRRTSGWPLGRMHLR